MVGSRMPSNRKQVYMETVEVMLYFIDNRSEIHPIIFFI